MPDEPSRDEELVRTAEVVAALSLATDLALGVSLEHGLHSALVASRLCDCLGADADTAALAYYLALLYYVGCTATAGTAADIFGDENALTTYGTPVRFGSPARMAAGMARAVAPPGQPLGRRAMVLARGLPRLAREFPGVVAAQCDVARMLSDRLGLPSATSALFVHANDRWDGRGGRRQARGDAIPLAVRIVQVARDAAFQRMLGGDGQAVSVVRGRAGGAFDPDVAMRFADRAGEILAIEPHTSAWADVLRCEPRPNLVLEGAAIDRAMSAIGDFADLLTPHLVGHSAGVAELAAAAGARCRLRPDELRALRRAALVHDLGRVAVPVRIWQHPGPLSPDDREQVRLHAYHTERVLNRSPFLAALTPIAAFHHERLDGSGYHREATASTLGLPARLLAAADVYHAMTEPRPHRAPLSPERAAEAVGAEARAGRLDPDAVGAVLTAAGQHVPRIAHPAGLTDREREVVVLLVRGMQTKQVARTLAISVKTADHHIQNAYRKMGVSTRAGAALFATRQGLLAWGELPMGSARARS